MACAVVTGLCVLWVCLQTDLCGIRGTGGNDLQLGDCLEFTLPLCGSGVALQSHQGFRGQDAMEVKRSTSSPRKQPQALCFSVDLHIKSLIRYFC